MNNTLVKSDDNSTYSNKESDVNVSLSKNTSSDSLFQLKMTNTKLVGIMMTLIKVTL